MELKPKVGHLLFVSMDGFQAYRNKDYDLSPFVALLGNLSPQIRCKVRNAIPFFSIPGPKEPMDLKSILIPFIEEINAVEKNGGVLLQLWDGVERRVRIHVMWTSADIPATSKMACLTGPNGTCSCGYCLIGGMLHPSSRHYYFPSKVFVGRNIVCRP